MDLETCVDRLEQLVAEARPVPLSAAVMVQRGEIEELLDELRERLPDELRQARWVLKERDELLVQAEEEGARILTDAREERDRLVADVEVARAARREADRILGEAAQDARVLRLRAEDYVDEKLAELESSLQALMGEVRNGRERLRPATEESLRLAARNRDQGVWDQESTPVRTS